MEMAADFEAVRKVAKSPGVHVITGPSGCGKSTFVESLAPHIFMSQYHAIRPDGVVDTFYPMAQLKLPFLVSKGTRFGGQLMPGLDVKGLSGGQRKLCICAHINLVVIRSAKKLIIVLDEPLAGVTSNYIGYVTDMIHEWSKRGNSVAVIDNDHHEHTTNQGWGRIKIDQRVVVHIDGNNTNIAVPRNCPPRSALRKDVCKDFRVYLRHEMFNPNSLNNQRVLQAVFMQFVSLPFSYDPMLDVGCYMQLMLFFFILFGTNGNFVPGRIAQYQRVFSEASIGLITAPGETLLMIQIHDVAFALLGVTVIVAVQSTAWNVERYSIWQLYEAALMMFYAQSALYVGLPFLGLPLAAILPVMGLDMLLFFYIGGPISPSNTAGVMDVGFLCPYFDFMYFTTDGAVLPAGIPPNFSFSENVINLFLGLFLFGFTLCFFSPWLKCIREENRSTDLAM